MRRHSGCVVLTGLSQAGVLARCKERAVRLSSLCELAPQRCKDRFASAGRGLSLAPGRDIRTRSGAVSVPLTRRGRSNETDRRRRPSPPATKSLTRAPVCLVHGDVDDDPGTRDRDCSRSHEPRVDLAAHTILAFRRVRRWRDRRSAYQSKRRHFVLHLLFETTSSTTLEAACLWRFTSGRFGDGYWLSR